MFYLIGAALLYTIAVLLGATAARNANTNLVGGITNLVGALLPLTVAAIELNRKPFENQRYGVIAAVAGGVAIALFVMLLNKSFVVNKVGIVAPIVFGSSILFTTIAGYAIFKEKVTPYQLVGLVLLLSGLAFIAYAKATGK